MASATPPISYAEARNLARDPDPDVRAALAGREDIAPELLYYLAEDEVAEVRRAVAKNMSAPRQTDLLLARDDDHRVRGGLAAKIAKVAPELGAEASERVRAQTQQALDTLANDQITQVRAILAEAIKDVVDAPPDVIRTLARDIAIEVAGPVLEFSPVLTEADLVEIIESVPIEGAVAAVARRDGVSENLSDAIIATDDVEGIADLLGNHSAQIRESALDELIDRSEDIELWQAPLVSRPKLPEGAAERMAGFIAENLLDALRSRGDLDERAMKAVTGIVRERINKRNDKPKKALAAGFDFLKVEPPVETAQRLMDVGKLEDDVITKALQAGDHAFVFAAMIVRAGVSTTLARKVFKEKNPQGIVALMGKAAMPAALLVMVQQQMGRLAPSQVIEPGEDETFPMSDAEIDWHIEFFGDMASRG